MILFKYIFLIIIVYEKRFLKEDVVLTKVPKNYLKKNRESIYR